MRRWWPSDLLVLAFLLYAIGLALVFAIRWPVARSVSPFVVRRITKLIP
jgi:hypothetical protein